MQILMSVEAELNYGTQDQTRTDLMLTNNTVFSLSNKCPEFSDDPFVAATSTNF